eukprot:329481_1
MSVMHKDTNINDSQIRLNKHLQNMMDSATQNIQMCAKINMEQECYDEAARYISLALSKLAAEILPELMSYSNIDETVEQYVVSKFNMYCSKLRQRRVECYLASRRYEQALRDLDWIIQKSKTYKYGPHENWIISMLPHYKLAQLTRAKTFLFLGNTGMSLRDCMDCQNTFDNDIVEDSGMEQITDIYVKLTQIRHPSPETFCTLKYNECTKRLNKFSLNGWIEFKSIDNLRTLPFKQGHVMISYRDKIYCFGGTNAEYGMECMHQNPNDILFYEISIHQTQSRYHYTWKQIHFPNKLKNKIINDTGTVMNDWSRLVTINKWKGNLLIIGSQINLFYNVLFFNCQTERWNILSIAAIKFQHRKYIFKNHSSTIMQDKLYVFGGQNNGTENNLLFC